MRQARRLVRAEPHLRSAVLPRRQLQLRAVPNLSDAGAKSAAQAYCTQTALGALVAGVCTLSGVSGVCTYSGATASTVGGEPDVYTTVDAANAAQQCSAAGGSWKPAS